MFTVRTLTVPIRIHDTLRYIDADLHLRKSKRETNIENVRVSIKKEVLIDSK